MGEGEVLLVTPTQWASAKALGAAGVLLTKGKRWRPALRWFRCNLRPRFRVMQIWSEFESL